MAKICLDAGHGIETAGKRSPDGTYLEHEFNLDVTFRLKALLERHGVEVTLARSTQNDVTLTDRVRIANNIPHLDLFVSIHSNASGNGWTSPKGYGIYTFGSGANHRRNIAANKILDRAKQAGIPMWGGGLHHRGTLFVLRYTTAPAVLIEHGFHTNKEEVELLKSSECRQKLAEIDCKGILDYLGITWKEKTPTVEVKTMATVRFGSRGDTVKTLQAMLNERRYNAGSVDGIFGQRTYNAVVAFQRASKIGVDGIVGKQTWTALQATADKPVAPRKYYVHDGIHIVPTDIKNFKIEMVNEQKKSIPKKNYCTGGFFSTYIGFTLPVGHVTCDYSATHEQMRTYCIERGRFTRSGKFEFDSAAWKFDNPIYKRNVSTLTVKDGHASIVDIVHLPTGLDYAISGVPIMRNGNDVKFATYVIGQGWTAGSLYNTWHTFVGIKQNDSKIYVMGMRTTSGNMILSAEAYRRFRALGMHDVIKLDGGGSFHMDVDGKAVASTLENRRINTIISF